LTSSDDRSITWSSEPARTRVDGSRLPSSASEIAACMAVLGRHLGQALDSASVDDLSTFVQHTVDDPELAPSRLPGLIRRSIAWHRAFEECQVRPEADLDMDEHAARPPVPLPDVDGVSFLATVGEIVAEGAQMRHCIATCARSAVAGDCDLFHVEHRSEHATVEVSRTGRVRQATGPKNRRNRAATWG
jgi:hypothetical protein